MNDTKNESPTGWESADSAPAGWDVGQAEKLAEFEQGSRARSASERAKRESTGERVEVVSEIDATSPDRVYKPLERQAAPEIEQEEQEQDSPEIGGGGDGSASWDDQQAAAASNEAEAVAIEGQAEHVQAEELAAEDPTAGLNEAELAALQQVMGAMDASRGHDQEIER